MSAIGITYDKDPELYRMWEEIYMAKWEKEHQ